MRAPFNATHLNAMTPTEEARRGLSVPGAAEVLERLAVMGTCDTILTDDAREVLGVVAAFPVAPGKCEALIISSEEQKRHPLVFVRGVRDALATIRQHFGTIQALGEDAPFYDRWLSWLGFSRREALTVNGIKMTMWEMSA